MAPTIMRSNVCLLTIVGALFTGACESAPPPPEGYNRSFFGTIAFDILYDDPTLAPELFDRSTSFDLVQLGDDTYATTLGPCDVEVSVEGVTRDGVVQLFPVPFPLPCSYESTTGSTFDITFTTADIDWSPDSFDAILDGEFTSRTSAGEGRAGTYSIYVTAF